LTRIKAGALCALQAAALNREQPMSILAMAFVGMVIAGMSLLVAALGWVVWYTRDRSDQVSTAPVVEPGVEHRKAA
jgi:hypothetical protein